MSRGSGYDSLIQLMINHIKENTTGPDQWIKIRMVDAAAILNKPVSTCSIIMREVLKDANIVTRTAPEDVGTKSSKSKQFRYEMPKAEPVKAEMHTTFKNLTKQEAAHAEGVLFNYGVRTPNRLGIVMNVLNAFNSRILDKARNIVPQIADLLIETETTIKDSLNILVASSLIENVNVEKKAEPVAIKAAVEPVKQVIPNVPGVICHVAPIVHSTPSTVSHVDKVEEVKVEIKEDVVVTPEASPALIEALNNFSGMQSQFFDYFKGLAENLSGGANKEELTELRADNGKLLCDLDSANDIIQKLLNENGRIKDDLREKKDQIDFANRGLKACRDKTDAVIYNMQSTLECLLAQITNAISNYTQVPAWDKTPQKNAQFQSTVINAVTTAVSDILAFNKTNGRNDD